MRSKENSYEEMPKDGIYEDSEVKTWNPPAQNEYEMRKWNSDGYDQSGMK